MAENRPKILIVDDKEIERATLEAYLEKENYQLFFASGGHEAIQKTKEIMPDVIILDVIMRDLNGYQVCRTLKKDRNLRNIPILLLTVLKTKEEIRRGLDAGADEFVTKPGHALEIRARLRTMLRIKKQYDEIHANLKFREELIELVLNQIRKSITPILGLSNLLISPQNDLNLENLANVKKIHKETQELNSFINNFLMLTLLEGGDEEDLIINRKRISLSDLIKKVEENQGFIAQSRNLNLIVLEPEEKPDDTLLLDENLFERVLENILSNAIDHSLPNGVIKLLVEYHGSTTATNPLDALRVRLKIIDEGPGISKEKQEELFDTIEENETEENGTEANIGLKFCKLVVEAHGGNISVESNFPTGAIFTIELPLSATKENSVQLSNKEKNEGIEVKLFLERNQVQLSKIIDCAIASQNAIAQAKRIPIVALLSEHDSNDIISLDEKEVLGALEIILCKAIKHSPMNKPITILLEYDGFITATNPSDTLRVRLKIIDEGPLISEEEKERFLNETVKIPSVAQNQWVAKQGLNHCKLVAESHGGRFCIQPNSPTGTIFIMEFPLSTTPQE